MEGTYRQNQWSCKSYPRISLAVSGQMSTTIKEVVQLEMVQRRAARFVKSVPHRRIEPPTSVSAMVSDLGWEPLQNAGSMAG